MDEVIGMNNVINANQSTIEWKSKGYKKDGSSYPLKTWKNLECILKKNNIEIKYNTVTKEIESSYPCSGINTLLTDIYTLNIEEFLNMSREETYNAIVKIAEENSYNPFIDMVKEHENTNYEIIHELFKCIKINDDNEDNYNYYFTLFTKWCLNVIKMASNTKEKQYRLEGVLVLQGKQGCRKTTFVEKLIPIEEMYKGDKTLYPDKIDSIIENTRYILVEWGELDHTLMADQSKIKQYITRSIDEYRSPYARAAQKYPRVTSYIGTVNRKYFLKDETGSRRFWVIPVLGFDFDKLESINKKELWGAVYSLWKSGSIKDYLEKDEMEKLNIMNRDYNFKDDVSYVIDEKINWDMPKEQWHVYSITEIAYYLMIKEKKGLEYKVYRINSKQVKKGFCIPRFEISVY
ncbi:VapE domain-containing protein [uncultured Clostridium sp.]|uniref:VapE domain-containing protein n=1 Tax=uncultured Clostridium sp. TaxID=59620 RepID=UPI0025E48F38|nr:VapE domain-containing protein [uncultured Clostridium sp.]